MKLFSYYRLEKIRIVKEGGSYYPEYKRWFWWFRFTETKCQEIGWQTFCNKYYVKYSTLKDAKDYAKNQITETYSFSGRLEGEILKEVDGWLIGYVIRQPRVLAIRWDNDGQDCNNYGYNLTPVKLEWFDYPENYPAMLIRDTEEHLGHKWVDNKKDFIKSHRQGFRLITKAERDSYFCKED